MIFYATHTSRHLIEPLLSMVVLLTSYCSLFYRTIFADFTMSVPTSRHVTDPLLSMRYCSFQHSCVIPVFKVLINLLALTNISIDYFSIIVSIIVVCFNARCLLKIMMPMPISRHVTDPLLSTRRLISAFVRNLVV